MAAFCAWRGGFEVLDVLTIRQALQHAAVGPALDAADRSGSPAWCCSRSAPSPWRCIRSRCCFGDRARLNRLYGPQSLEEEISTEIGHAGLARTPRRRAGHDRHRLRHDRLPPPPGGDDARPAHRHRDVRRRLHRRRALPRLARRQCAGRRLSRVDGRVRAAAAAAVHPARRDPGALRRDRPHVPLAGRLAQSAARWAPAHQRGGIGPVLGRVSGSSVATAATISTVALPSFRKKNYDTRMVLGSIAAGGSLGNLIPPGIAFIIYGVLTNTSVARLYAGGVFPGLALTRDVHGRHRAHRAVAALDRAARGQHRSRCWCG